MIDFSFVRRACSVKRLANKAVDTEVLVFPADTHIPVVHSVAESPMGLLYSALRKENGTIFPALYTFQIWMINYFHLYLLFTQTCSYCDSTALKGRRVITLRLFVFMRL